MATGNLYDDYPQLRTIFKPGRNVSHAQFEAELLKAGLPYKAFTDYPQLAKTYPNVAAASKQQDTRALEEYQRVFNQPWENAPKRGTAVSDYGGVYFGTPGLSPSSVPRPQGGWEAYQRNVSQAPGAGLMAIGIHPDDPNAEAKAQAWLDYNRRQGTGLWQEGAWGSSFGREDARMPGYAALAKKNMSARDIVDTLMREQYAQSALKPRTFDIADVLVPAGEVLLGAVTGAPWASMALGGGYGAANKGLLGGVLGAAAGAGAGGFGADWASQGLSGAISNQIPDVSNIFSGGASLPSVPRTPAGLATSAADVINSVSSSLFPSNSANRGITSTLPTAAFGAQAAGAFKPAPANIAPKITPAFSNVVPKITPTPAAQKPSVPQIGPKPMNITAPVGPVKPLAEGGFLAKSDNPMNPMGGAPASAYGLAALGRGGDTTLMHVSPGEVDALQKLAEQHGGSLTVNPQTGLPEAGFLSSILPAIAGIGLTVASGGALSPLAAGLLTGGATALITGDIKKGLLGGLGAFGGAGLAGGLGAAGIGAGTAGTELTSAGVANALPSAYSEIGREAASAAAKQGLETAASQPGFFGGLGNMSLGNAASGLSNIGKGVSTIAKEGFSEAGPGVFGLTGGKGLLASGAAALAPAMFEKPTPITPRDPWGGKGVTSAYEGPWEFNRDVRFPEDRRALTDSSEFDYFGPGYYESATGRRMASGGIARFADGGMSNLGPIRTHSQFEKLPVKPVEPKSVASSVSNTPMVGQTITLPNGIKWTIPNFALGAFGGAFGVRPQQTTAPATPQKIDSAYKEPNYGYWQKYYSNSPEMWKSESAPYGYYITRPAIYGNSAVYAPIAAPPGAATASSTTPTTAGSNTAATNTLFGPVRTHKQFAEGGSLSEFMALKHGGTPHKGGYLDGPGDGMSDSIPATIEDKQPARLADGEFVVPADVVSHIGNGSSKAGAKRLYAMMDKIRHARTGNKKQGKQINPDKFLPA